MNVEQGFQLSDLKGIVRRRGPLALLIAGAIVAIALPLAAWLPNQYQAYATLLVEPQTVSKRLVEAGVEETDINQRLHLMTMQILSRGRLSKIIDDLKLYPDESKHMTREQVIDVMRGKIRVEPVLPEFETQQNVRRSELAEINTFRLFFVHENANTAAAVANRLANDFIQEHIKERVQISGDTSDFLESELGRLAARIQEVEAQIAKVKLENPGRLPEDQDANQRLLEHFVENLREAQRELAEAESDEAFYRQQALVSTEAVPNWRNEADPYQRLQLLELQLAGYRSRGFTEKHPDVISTELEIQEVKKRLESGAELRSRSSLSVAQQNAEAEARRAALRAASAKEQIAKLGAQADEVQKQLADAPRVAEQLAALDREYKHLFESFQQFSGKRLEAGVAANMELRQKGEQVKVLEAAFPPPEPVSPKRIVIVAVSVLLGLAIGAGVSILLESADSSFHEAGALQEGLRIPVLASIPAIVLDADRAAERRHRARLAVASGLVAAFVLLSSGAGYVYRNVIEPGAETAPEESAGAAAPGAPTPAAPAARPAPVPAPPLPSVIESPAGAPAPAQAAPAPESLN